MIMVRKQSTIEVDVRDWHLSKSFLGTEEQTYNEAMDWMNAVVLQYISANDITDPYDIDNIWDAASHTIIWENSDFICMYAVFGSTDLEDEPIIGIYPTLADAEEVVLSECETWVEEYMNTETPMDAFGNQERNFAHDYWYLMHDCANTYFIQVVPTYGVEEPLN